MGGFCLLRWHLSARLTAKKFNMHPNIHTLGRVHRRDTLSCRTQVEYTRTHTHIMHTRRAETPAKRVRFLSGLAGRLARTKPSHIERLRNTRKRAAHAIIHPHRCITARYTPSTHWPLPSSSSSYLPAHTHIIPASVHHSFNLVVVCVPLSAAYVLYPICTHILYIYISCKNFIS